MNVEKFKKDHNEILALVAELRTITQAGIAKNADAIAQQIRTMSSVIKLHLAAEDRVLYPALAKSQNPAVAKVGERFQQEMGGIAAAYMEFAGKWTIGSKVSSNPEGFKEEANNLFKALHERIQKENQELYPLADQI
ncbi:hemerythrin domain-containing protein [Noviherbaspirillum saxi]|uniref:Hemerythrin domain-containing protein n=2 Tax=Noviherbaspirillum saxi TaxID=2320863 RepID=A0A3A3FFR8_9BURK|nr:hemerythrin domain-containing protein [Noviherbaspirillum saxi]